MRGKHHIRLVGPNLRHHSVNRRWRKRRLRAIITLPRLDHMGVRRKSASFKNLAPPI